MLMAIVIFSVWTLIARTVLGSISIEVELSGIEYGHPGGNINCVVNGSNLIGVTSIRLMRSEINVVSVTKYTVVWEDKELENKTGVTANASISNVMSSYLQLKIPGSVFRYPKDIGSYQCILSCVIADGGTKIYDSQSIVLNIPGFSDSTTELFFSTNHKSSDKTVQKGYLEFSTESHKNNISLQNENKTESFLILYRKIMIPVATFISCIFAFIIVRELRLYYGVSKPAATNKTGKKYTNGVYIV